MCSSSSTPAACIKSPPTPRSRNRAPPSAAANSRATLEAWRSPEGSPATNRISRTAKLLSGAGVAQLRKGAVHLVHDSKRDGQRVAPVLAGDHHLRFAAYRRKKALVLQPQRLAFRRLELDALDERLDGLRGLRELRQIDVRPQPVELTRSRAQIQGEVAVRLVDAQFAQRIS